jgi:hypothetical protein
MPQKGTSVKTAILVGLMAVTPSVALGQDPPPAGVQEGVPAAAPVQHAPAPASARVENRRQAIRMMEAILSQAVRGGAETLAERLGSGNPNMSFFTGQARARGFILEGYGVFFHVEIPEMQQSLVFSVTTMERDMAVASTLDTLSRVVASAPEGASKIEAEQAIKRLQLQFAPAPLTSPAASVPPGTIRSAEARTVADTVDPVPPVPSAIMRDPNGAYRDAIKSALIDAMLEHSRGVHIQPDEWLTVAAQRGDSPLSPNEIVTSATLVLRIKGSDLALYDADRTRKDEIRQRVEVREF